MQDEVFAKLRLILLSLALILGAGTAGYVLIEGWPAFDALYMTVITVATIGYGETHPLSNAGRLFTIFLILGGLGVVGYCFSAATAFLVEGQLNDVLRRRRMQSRISALTGHYIVCGGGETGRTVMKELFKTKNPFVVVERDAQKVSELQAEDYLAIQGDALQDASLKEAGIERAAGVFCSLANDRDNAFAVITARGLSPRARIICELHDSQVADKLARSGADSAVSSGRIGGLRMVSEMIRPAAVGFLDSMIRDRNSVYRFEEIRLSEASPAAGKPLRSVKNLGAGFPLVLAVRAGTGLKYDINPDSERLLNPGESLVVLGDTEQVRKLQERVA